jgi:hypothetical protein
MVVHPTEERLLALYGDLIPETPILDPEERDVIETAIQAMLSLSSLQPTVFFTYLQKWLMVAAENWEAVGKAFFPVVIHVLPKLSKGHQDDLLATIHKRFAKEGIPLLKDPLRREEYEGLCKIIAAIHQAEGDAKRRFRPKHRHIVNDAKLSVRISMDSGTSVDACIGNFSVGYEWCGGAWAVVQDDKLAQNIGLEWQPTAVILEHPALTNPLSIKGEACRAAHEARGLRLKWPLISIEEGCVLQQLSWEYPLTR